MSKQNGDTIKNGDIIIRAIYAMNALCQTPYITINEWDSGLFPTAYEGKNEVNLSKYYNDKKLTLNLHPEATGKDGVQYDSNSDQIYFSLAFSGKQVTVYVPSKLVLQLTDINTDAVKLVQVNGLIAISEDIPKGCPEIEKFISYAPVAIAAPVLRKIVQYNWKQCRNPVFVKVRVASPDAPEQWLVMTPDSFTDHTVNEHTRTGSFQLNTGELVTYFVEDIRGSLSTVVDYTKYSVEVLDIIAPNKLDGTPTFTYGKDGLFILNAGLEAELKAEVKPEPKTATLPQEDVKDIHELAKSSNGKVVMGQFGRKK